MDENKMPYWIWACLQTKASNSRQIGLGEIFVALLDRLDEYGIDTGAVIDGLANLAETVAHCSGGGLDETVVCFQTESGRIGRVASLLRTRSGEREYEELQKLACSLFDVIGTANNRISSFQINPEPFDRSIARLLQAMDKVADRFKTDVLNAHTSFFKQDAYCGPVHLGYMVYSIHLLGLAVERLRMHVKGPDVDRSGDTASFSSGMFCELLNWTGDFMELEHYYWRLELNEITGIDY